MYKVNNKVYSEAGYILIGKNIKGYQFEGELSDFTEEPLSVNDMVLNGEYVAYSGIVQYVGEKPTYAQMKGDMVKRRYSNDDQLAIMLNDDEEAMRRMQEWRVWSSTVASKIMELVAAKDEPVDE